MEKNKNKEGITVSQRSKAITGVLENCGVRITITPEKPEDWKIIRGYYIAFKKNLFKDMFPFMQMGASVAGTKKKTSNESKQSVIYLIQTQAALLEGFLRGVKHGDVKQLPSLAVAIKAVDDTASIQRPNRERINTKAFIESVDEEMDTKIFTKLIVETVYSDIISHSKMRGYNNEYGFTPDNFNHTHIKAGKDILKSNKGPDSLSGIHNVLVFMDMGKYANFYNRPFFELLKNLIRSIRVRYRGYDDSSEVISSVKNPEELDLMGSIIKKSFPAITMP